VRCGPGAAMRGLQQLARACELHAGPAPACVAQPCGHWCGRSRVCLGREVAWWGRFMLAMLSMQSPVRLVLETVLYQCIGYSEYQPALTSWRVQPHAPGHVLGVRKRCERQLPTAFFGSYTVPG